MSDAEELRSALFQLEQLRAREATARRHSTVLYNVLDAMTSAQSRSAALEGLIGAVRSGLGCSVVSIAGPVNAPGSARGQAGLSALRFHLCTDPALSGLVWVEGGWAFSEVRALVDTAKVEWPAPLPEALAPYRAILAAPFDSGSGQMALVCLDRRGGAFTQADRSLMRRVAMIASQTLRARQQASRNALLTALLEAPLLAPCEAALPPEGGAGAALPAPLSDPLSPERALEQHFERALDKLTRSQLLASELISLLLDAPHSEIAAVVGTVLEKMGHFCGSDRITLVRFGLARPLSVYCEWCAPGIAPSVFSSEGFDEATLRDWCAKMRRDGALYLQDSCVAAAAPGGAARLGGRGVVSFLAVPVLQDGEIAGFLAHASESAPMQFLPGEVHMKQAVANVAGALIARDVALSEVVRVRGALAESEHKARSARARLEGAVEALPDGFACFDADDRLVLFNAAFRGIFPADLPVETGMTFSSLLEAGAAAGAFPEACGNEADWCAKRLEFHRSGGCNNEVKLADGRWLRVIEKPLPDAGQVALWIDVTELKQSVNRALSDRAAAMDASSDGIALLDGTARFTYINTAMREMLGLPDDFPVIGRACRRVAPPAVVRHWHRHAMRGLAVEGAWRGELALDLPERGASVLELSLSARDEVTGGVLAICRDVTARQRDFATQVRLREELQVAQRREIISQMAAGLAHDFNNLLAAISGSATLILRTGAEAATPHAQRIHSAVQQAGALIERLTEIGSRRPARVAIDLREQVWAAADLLRADLGSNIELVLDLPETAVMVEADAGDILQVVLNLAVNARDAVRDPTVGRGAQKIVIALTEPRVFGAESVEGLCAGQLGASERYARLSVADTGCGIDPETRARMFEPYFTTKSGAGSGLGLSIVSGVLGANGGAVAVQSAPGRGTRIEVFWPTDARVPVRKEPLPREAAPESGGTLRADNALQGRLILLVDDNSDVLEILTAFLEQAGAEVAGCTDPRDALEGLREDPGAWDLLITDYDMGPINGSELFQAVRLIAPDLPILLVTALPDWRGRPGAKGGLFCDVLGKPVTQERLVAAAVNAVGRSTT